MCKILLPTNEMKVDAFVSVLNQTLSSFGTDRLTVELTKVCDKIKLSNFPKSKEAVENLRKALELIKTKEYLNNTAFDFVTGESSLNKLFVTLESISRACEDNLQFLETEGTTDGQDETDKKLQI